MKQTAAPSSAPASLHRTLGAQSSPHTSLSGSASRPQGEEAPQGSSPEMNAGRTGGGPARRDPRQEGDRTTVLLIEDDPLILELLEMLLITSGYEVIVAANADEGLACFREHSARILCVILDYGIPGMHAARLLNGFLETDPFVKVILSSGYPSQFINQDFPMDLVVGFLEKPFVPQSLIELLDQLRS